MNTAKKTRDLERTRKNLLSAGRKEFAKYGIEGARVDRIAKNAGVNKQMIYYIFGGKDELYLAALESLWEQKWLVVDQPLMTQQVGIESIPMVIGQVLEIFLKNQEAARMLLYDILQGAPTLRKLKKKRPDLFAGFEGASRLLDALQSGGMIQPIDTTKAIFMVALVILAFPVAFPNFDVIVPKGSEPYKSASSMEAWKEFLAEVIGRILLVKPERSGE